MANSGLSYAPTVDIQVRSLNLALNSPYDQGSFPIPMTWSGGGGPITASFQFTRIANWVYIQLLGDHMVIGNGGACQSIAGAVPEYFRPATVQKIVVISGASGGAAVACNILIYPGGGIQFHTNGLGSFVINVAATGVLAGGGCYWVGASS